MPVKYLVVNADDFGLSSGINQGVMEAHERGIVTSASLMVRWPSATEAAAYARGRDGLSLGIHIDLGEWAYKGGEWRPLYEVVASQEKEAVEAEVRGQIDAFRRLTDRNPTHIDSHQHVHREEPARSVLRAMARELSVSLRDYDAVNYRGDFYGQLSDGSPWPQGITVESLVSVLRSLREGVTELACHPGRDLELNSPYRLERMEEVRVLSDQRVKRVIREEGIVLCSHGEFDPRAIALMETKGRTS